MTIKLNYSIDVGRRPPIGRAIQITANFSPPCVIDLFTIVQVSEVNQISTLLSSFHDIGQVETLRDLLSEFINEARGITDGSLLK